MKRTREQNSRMWALLRLIASSVEWHGQRLDPESWKLMFSASLKRQQVVPGLDGGFVVLGVPTSSMTKREMSDLQEVIAAFAAEHGVELENAA